MQTHQKQPFLTEDAYLASEEQATVRHEYVDGYIYAMAGANVRHNLIAGNVSYHLRTATRGTNCQPFISDMKLRIQERKTFYYPDVMLCCNTEDNHDLYRESPCFIAEVLSPSTETIDRREKLMVYQRIPSLRYYLLIATHQMQVEYYQRGEDGSWYMGTLSAEETLEIQCGAHKPLVFCWADFYQDVVLP